MCIDKSKTETVKRLISVAKKQYGESIEPCCGKFCFCDSFTVGKMSCGNVGMLWFNVENHSTKVVTEAVAC